MSAVRENSCSPASDPARLKIVVRGAVQGVGFRPFIYRLATELQLTGWVRNSPQGVFLEVEGPRRDLEKFLLRVESEKPPRSSIHSLEASWLDPAGLAGFEIRASEAGGEKTALVLPDIATCPDCLREIFDPGNRRHRYPFTNCTNCGPRFSIIEALPYDRARTSMKKFAMCPQCRAEYDDPRDRRFHAQPNACPVCGPHLELWDRAGRVLHSREEALAAAAEAVRQGRIVAVKGLGGFHLMVAAQDDQAVHTLRERKHREEKPLALIFPTLDSVKQHCQVSELEGRLLRSPEAPIVLLHGQPSTLSPSIAPGNPYLGAMLPYTPLHHLLSAELGFPVVATSGNLSDEPICIDEQEALERLGGIADVFLMHNRPIVRHVDDSMVRVMLGRELVLRRARGYAPLPIHLAAARPEPRRTILAVGAHLKSAVALAVGPQVFVSQHLGDLENAPALNAFRRVIADLQQLYQARPEMVAADAHPDYLSTKFAQSTGLPVVRVQHHHAHILSCLAENELEPPVLGVSWDGTGYGLDGTIWGGEFLKVTASAFERFGHLRTFRLPGGEAAVREPRRAALGLLYEILGEALFEMGELAPVRAFRAAELALLRQSLQKGLNAPVTSSMGRLFDAVAGLMGLRQIMRFEGQAAMELEFALDGVETDEAYEMPIADRESQMAAIAPAESVPVNHDPLTPALSSSDGERAGVRGGFGSRPVRGSERNKGLPAFIMDWVPLVHAVLADVREGVAVGLISARFHNALAEALVEMARRAGEPRVVLSGGCFQNKYLTERAVRRLQAAGFQPYWHQRVPPNDGGLALGQAAAAARADVTQNRPCV